MKVFSRGDGASGCAGKDWAGCRCELSGWSTVVVHLCDLMLSIWGTESAGGSETCLGKVAMLWDARELTNVIELNLFLWLPQYYSKFPLRSAAMLCLIYSTATFGCGERRHINYKIKPCSESYVIYLLWRGNSHVMPPSWGRVRYSNYPSKIVRPRTAECAIATSGEVKCTL